MTLYYQAYKFGSSSSVLKYECWIRTVERNSLEKTANLLWF